MHDIIADYRLVTCPTMQKLILEKGGKKKKKVITQKNEKKKQRKDRTLGVLSLRVYMHIYKRRLKG